jgi:sugar phosphate isomerase/epimerase
MPAGQNLIGMSTGAVFPDYLTEDALNIAARYGFDVVEAYIQTPGEYTPAFVAEVKRRLDEFGLAVHSLHNDVRHYDLWSSYVRRAAESYALFERLIAMAADLGAKAITWHGFQNHLDDPAAFDRFASTARTLGEQAQQSGVTLTVENVSWCYLRRVEHIRRVQAACLPLGFTFDPFQAREAGQSPPDIIRAMGDQLVTVHLSDFGCGEIRHLSLGQGSIDWPPIFQALADIGYRGPLIVEAPYRGDLNGLARDRAFVERYLSVMQA